MMAVKNVYAFEEQFIDVLVPNFPPYTYKDNNEFQGIGIEQARKIFEQAGITASYQLAPNYGKIVHSVKHGKGDAFLLASQNDERDQIAKFSQPVMVNRWSWYVLNDSQVSPHSSNFKSQARVSTHFNANTHKWLTKHGYDVKPAMGTVNLPEMLLLKRVDAVFIAELVFEQALAKNNISPTLFKKYVEVEKDFCIYVSNTYLNKFPETLTKINKAITTLKNANSNK